MAGVEIGVRCRDICPSTNIRISRTDAVLRFQRLDRANELNGVLGVSEPEILRIPAIVISKIAAS